MGDLEAEVTILLATPPNNPLFYMDALRAVSLASAVSPALHEPCILSTMNCSTSGNEVTVDSVSVFPECHFLIIGNDIWS